MLTLKKIRKIATLRPQVIREGRTFRVSPLELVVGDRVLLEEGDRVPGEGVLTSGFPLKVEEPTQDPNLIELTPEHAELSPNSKVVRGKGIMELRAQPLKGRGDFFQSTTAPRPRRHEDFLKQSRESIRQVFWSAILVDFILLIFFVWLKKDWEVGIQFGGALLVCLVPFEIPLLLWFLEFRVARKFFSWGIGIRDLTAVETLGRITHVLSGERFALKVKGWGAKPVRQTVFTPFASIRAEALLASLDVSKTGRVITQNEIELMEDGVLSRELDHFIVFSGLSQEQKLRIGKILIKKGDRVAVVGEEREDALLLERVHLGVALGYVGVDSLRESADLVLLREEVESWFQAIQESRKFGNQVHQILEYLVSLRMVLVGLSLFSLIFALPLILMPGTLAMVLGVIGPVSILAMVGSYPTKSGIQVFDFARTLDQKWWKTQVTHSSWVLLGLALVGAAAWYLGKGEWDTRGLILCTFAFANSGWVFRMSGRVLDSRGYGVWASGFGLAFYFALMAIPEIRTLLQVNPIHPIDFGVCAAVGWGFSQLNKKS
jgi:magnesium-transporting ATPase (P-type)